MFSKSTALLSFLFCVPTSLNAQRDEWGPCGWQGWNDPQNTQCLRPTAVPSLTELAGQPSSIRTITARSSPQAAPGNPYSGYTVYLSPHYANQVQIAARRIADPTQKAKALKVASIPMFIWFDQTAQVPKLGSYLADAQAKQQASGEKYLVQIVLYNIPNRDCSAAASNGEFSVANNGLEHYKGYIDLIVGQIKKYPDVRVVAVIEPDVLGNLVTNLRVAKCKAAESTYFAGIQYALQQLNSVGVYMYLDAGHAGWLGWPANLGPAASLFARVYKNAGSPSFVRGLATNVANYNALRAASPDPITKGNPNYDETHYINAIAPKLTSSGFPAHFIVDQGRSGVQNIRSQWGDWCNVKAAGFGTRPTTTRTTTMTTTTTMMTDTGSAALIDAIVWVKPGGDSDGISSNSSSSSSSAHFDPHCARSDALQPSPEEGEWFQEYFEQLVENANPAL